MVWIQDCDLSLLIPHRRPLSFSDYCSDRKVCVKAMPVCTVLQSSTVPPTMRMMPRQQQQGRLLLLALLLPAGGAAFLAPTTSQLYRHRSSTFLVPSCAVSDYYGGTWSSPRRPSRRRRIPQPLLQTTNSDNNDSNEEDSADDVIEYDDFGGKVIGGDSTASSSASEKNANINFDDFGSQYVGDSDDDKTAPVSSSSSSSSSSTSTVLQDRMASVTQQERRHEAVLGRNWKLGNWQVRGFSLEDVAATTVGASAGRGNGEDGGVDAPRQPEETTTLSEDDDALPPPAVCQIAKDEDDPGQIWVGRTDGSVFGIRLGTSYWTRLQQNSDNNQAGSIQAEPPSQPPARMGDEFGDDDDDDEMEPPPLPQSPPGKPFEIRTQLHAGSSPVTALVSAACSSSTEDGGDDTSYLFTATADSGIQQWLVMEQEDPKEPEGPKIILSKQLEGAHSSQTVNFLRAVSLELDDDDDDSLAAEAAPTVLLSADHNSIAVWDLVTGDLLGQCCVGLESILDAEVFPPSSLIQSVDTDGTHVFVGTSTGHVLAYRIADLLLSSRSSPADDDTAATTTTTTPTTAKPVGQWKANSDGKPITALHCGGTGSMGARGSSRRTTSRTLYTGDADGGVKQWQVFAAAGRLEHWPKLATQRLPQRAHLFRGHDAVVTALAAVDALKFLSASSDGTGRLF